MKKLVFYFTATLLVAFLSSCSDDKSTTPDTAGTGLPLAIGNMWKYDSYEIDANGNTIGSKLGSHTNTVTGTITLGGKSAFILVEDDSETKDTSYIYADADGIYGYFSPEFPGGTAMWLKSIDFKNTKWDIFKINIDETDEEEGTTTKGVSGMKGERLASSKVTYKNKSYDVQNYINIIYSDVVVTYLDENNTPISQTISNSDTSYVSLIPGLGVYSSTSSEVNYTDEDIEVRTFKDILVDHNLK